MVAEKSKNKRNGKTKYFYCYHCSKRIGEKDKKTTLITNVGNKNVEEIYFHFDCWKDYFNQKVREKAEKIDTAGGVLDDFFGGMNKKSINPMSAISQLFPMIPRSMKVLIAGDGKVSNKDQEKALKNIAGLVNDIFPNDPKAKKQFGEIIDKEKSKLRNSKNGRKKAGNKAGRKAGRKRNTKSETSQNKN